MTSRTSPPKTAALFVTRATTFRSTVSSVSASRIPAASPRAASSA